jgi:hypothetical protein
MKKKEPIKLYNLSDIGEHWGLTRGTAHLHFNSGNMESPTHYRLNKKLGIEWLWDYFPPHPKRKKK